MQRTCLPTCPPDSPPPCQPPRPAAAPPTPPCRRSSRILWGLSGPLVFNFCIAIFVCTYETMHTWKLLPPLLPGMAWPSIVVSADGPFSLSTFALSLLLVFRTNSSYGRWVQQLALRCQQGAAGSTRPAHSCWRALHSRRSLPTACFRRMPHARARGLCRDPAGACQAVTHGG